MMKSKKLRLAAVLSVLALSVGSVFATTELAHVGNRVITLEEFNKKYQDNLKYFQFRAPPKKAVLEDIIKRELGVQAAKRDGLDRDPDIQDRMNTVLYQAYLDRKLGKEIEGIKISDSDVRTSYEKHPEIRTSQILIALPPEASTEDSRVAREKAQTVLDQDVRNGKMSFAEAAQRFSDAPSAPMGGDLDYQTREKLDPKYYEAALQLHAPGKVSDVVRTGMGFSIIKLTAIRPWEDADKAFAKRNLFEEKKTQLFDRLMAQLRAQLGVRENMALLKE